MTTGEFRDFCMLECVKVFLQKLPSVGLPVDNQGGYQRREFVRGLARDAMEVAEAMLQERNQRPLL